jgi:steroid 5-alpha reductase family enzyme
LWLLAMLGESVADAQLNLFRADPESKGKTCRVGLWRYSRHPNYFCEWLVWVGYFVYALGSPGGWLAAYAPALMYFFLTSVTGIKATEEHAVRSRGEDYREYQRTTNAFFPWWPHRAP